MGTPLTDVKGIGESTARDMQAHGIGSVEDLATASIDEITAVPGFGTVRARQIKEQAALLIQAVETVPVKAEPPQAEEPPGAPVESDQEQSKTGKAGKKDKKNKKKGSKTKEKKGKKDKKAKKKKAK